MTRSPITEREKMLPITAPAITPPDGPDLAGAGVAELVDVAKANVGSTFEVKPPSVEDVAE